MFYLLDTHTLIWYFEDSPKLPSNITSIIDNNAYYKCICSVSLWEIAIKTNIGKLTMSISFDDLLIAISNSDLIVMQMENEYLRENSKLPFFHKDPFDRMIISTAIAEDMTIITKDEDIQKYDVPWIW